MKLWTKAIPLIVIALLLSASVMAQGGIFISRESGFSIRFPEGAARIERIEQAGGDSTTFSSYIHAGNATVWGGIIIVMNVPPDLMASVARSDDKVLENAFLDAMSQGLKADLTDRKPTTLSGLPAMEFTYAIPTPNDKGVYVKGVG